MIYQIFRRTRFVSSSAIWRSKSAPAVRTSAYNFPSLLNISYRMFTSSLTEEVKALEVDIEAVKEKVDDPIMCTKIRQFVYAPREIQDLYKADAGTQAFFLL